MADRCRGSIGADSGGSDPAPSPHACPKAVPRALSSAHPRRVRAIAAVVLPAVLGVVGCDSAPSPPTPSLSSPPPPAAVPSPMRDEPKPPASATSVSNPLGLPPHAIKLDPGRRVFTFSDRMLAGAKLGSTLVLYAATVVGFEGDDLIIEGRGGPSYKVHPGYVIPVPDAPRVHPRDPVLTEWNGVMKHAIVTRFVKDRIEVRYTDMDARTPLAQLRNARFVRQADGLSPGNFAAWKDADGFRHVLLVSRLGDASAQPASTAGASGRWFALGYGGAALLVDEAALRPIPIRPELKVGMSVLAEWVGALRPAVVQSIDDTGLLTVKFERAGRPVTLGWGLVTPPLDP